MNCELSISSVRWLLLHWLVEFRRWIATCCVVVLIFGVDIVADPQVSVIPLYAALIVASCREVSPRVMALIGVGSGLLTIIGQQIGRQPGGAVDLINGTFGIIAIAIITYLMIRIDDANRAVRKMQADLAHASHLLLVDEMNTALAHELNQPLGAAAANAQAALRWLESTPSDRAETQRALKRAIEAVEYAGTIVHRRRELAQKTPPPCLPIDIARVIDEACALFEHQLRNYDVELRIETSKHLFVSGDGNRLRQVVINLLTNAIEAMADVAHSKALTIRASRQGDNVYLSFLDVGCGMDAPVEACLFEPFHTTKPSGLGMGLAISRTIVRAYGGAITAARNVPYGMVFTVCLPAVSISA